MRSQSIRAVWPVLLSSIAIFMVGSLWAEDSGMKIQDQAEQSEKAARAPTALQAFPKGVGSLLWK